MRRILRDAALGELGADLNTAADETLIATGLDAGDAEIAVSEEIPAPEEIVVSREAPVAEQSPDRPNTSRQRRSTTWSRRPASSSRSRPRTRFAITATPWLDEVESAPRARSTSPPIEGDVQHRERIDTPRVRHLFPVPEDADWEVRELKYDHYRHAG